ncbi:MAG: hypothetical protein FJ117_16920 [Deltaproteobacteria bacterium]|nr:hypothetical protein [Deltaproteobacteria bacterium]
MKCRVLSFFLIATLIFLGACQKKEPEKKEAGKKVSAGYVIKFKPNDSLELVPAKTFILQPGPVEGANKFCIDVVAKGIDPLSALSFDLNFDPAVASYQEYRPGFLLEQKGKPLYKVGPKGEQKGKLEVKVSYESGEGASGTGKVVTLCFKALEPGRSNFLFENGELLGSQKKKMPDTEWVGGLLWILETR